MSRILIGWEIGAGYGHVERCALHARALRAHGHDVTVALKIRHRAVPDAIPAPTWRGDGRRVPSVSLGSVLEQLGIGVEGQFAAIVGEWERIIARERPDVVVADFAPALLTAARGRARRILIGNGYDCPPSDLASFPALRPGPPHDEAEARRVVGAPLPSLFAADEVVVGALSWVDPYESLRPGVHLPPAPRTGVGALGEKAYVYWHGPMPTPLADGLRASGLAIRLWNPASPASWDEIAADSRIVVSHGGCGFTTQAALAGIPHLVASGDLEKHHYGRQVRSLGIGDWRAVGDLDAAWVAATARRLAQDDGQHRHSRKAAERMRAARRGDPVDKVVALSDGKTLGHKVHDPPPS